MLHPQGRGRLLYQHGHGREELRRLWQRMQGDDPGLLFEQMR
jgi:hypothetical protein